MRNWTVFKSGQSQNSNVDRPKGNDSTNIKSTVKMDGHESERSRHFDFAVFSVWSDIFIYIQYEFQYVFTCISLKTTQVQTPFKILPTCEIQKIFFRSQISFWLCNIDPNDSRRNNIWKKSWFMILLLDSIIHVHIFTLSHFGSQKGKYALNNPQLFYCDVRKRFWLTILGKDQISR